MPLLSKLIASISLLACLCSAPARANTEFEFLIGSDVPPSVRRQLVSVFGQASKYFRDSHDITLERSVTVMASRSLEHLARMMAANPRGPQTEAQSMSILNIRCANSEIGGLQLTGLIVVCLPRRSKGALVFNRAQMFGIKKLAVHELAHEVQSQIGKHPYAGEAQGSYADLLGPFWLVEGTAMAFEFNFQAPEISRKRWIELLLKERALYKTPLSALTSPGAVRSRADYLTSALAVQMALKGKSLKSILDYWQFLAEGATGPDAFEQAFGRSLDSIETELRNQITP